jgi:hypothetical protein
MKTLPYLAILLMFATCSSTENKTSTANDSIPVGDSSKTIIETAEDMDEVIELTGEDSMTFDQRFTAWKELIDSNTDSLLEVSITTHEYEAGSRIKWYFDQDITPVYYSMTWSAEGNEGSTEYIVKNSKVVCSWVEDNSGDEKWCLQTGGFRTTSNDASGEETKEELSENYGEEQSRNLQSELGHLSEFFGEATEVEEDGDWITFRLENVVNYGGEFTEYMEARVHKKVFEEFK